MLLLSRSVPATLNFYRARKATEEIYLIIFNEERQLNITSCHGRDGQPALVVRSDVAMRGDQSEAGDEEKRGEWMISYLWEWG